MNLSAAPADIRPAVLAVRAYGCAPRPDLDALATKSSSLLSSSSCDPLIERPLALGQGAAA
jgi:hypothetical protein